MLHGTKIQSKHVVDTKFLRRKLVAQIRTHRKRSKDNGTNIKVVGACHIKNEFNQTVETSLQETNNKLKVNQTIEDPLKNDTSDVDDEDTKPKNEVCPFCFKKFKLENKLKTHLNREHGVAVSCDICQQIFATMTSLRSHKSSKHTGKDKVCERCGYTTKKTYDFKRHQMKHNQTYAYTCNSCKKGFYSLYEFKEHRNVHGQIRPYQCEKCGVGYSRRSSLVLHNDRKHPESFSLEKRCSICNKVCRTKETMVNHMKTHVDGPKRYYCDICGKGLMTSVNLLIHRRSHTGEKPFDCSYCSRAFSCKKNLLVHIRLHTGERPFSCKICNKSYTKSSTLKVHEKIHHF